VSNEDFNLDEFLNEGLKPEPPLVSVDSRRNPNAPPVDPWESLSEKSRQESQALGDSLMPLMRPLNFRVTAPEKRDEACVIVMWKLNTVMSANWKENAEIIYQANLAKAREYWQKYVTPDETASAEKISADMKQLWKAPAAHGRQWPQQTLLVTLQTLGI
jgi:hypothetical protein